MANLDEMREQIDRIDAEIMNAFQERMSLSAEIAKYKKENNLPVLDEKREKEKLDIFRKAFNQAISL